MFNFWVAWWMLLVGVDLATGEYGKAALCGYVAYLQYRLNKYEN